MKGDAHIYSSDVPLGSGSQATGLCGKQVLNVHLVRIWDGQQMNVSPEYPSKGICEKCLKVWREQPEKVEGSLLYAIREDRGEVVFSE